MRTLVTGGAGFIGSHLCEALLERGDEVVALDNLSTSTKDNIAPLFDRYPGRFVLAIGDVRDWRAIQNLMSRVDRVFHLASVVGVKLYVDTPLDTISVIVDGTRVVLQAAQDLGVPVLITSTSEVYGKGIRLPMVESDDLCFGPTTSKRWSYGLSKAIDEQMALSMQELYGTTDETGFRAHIARLFNTVGPRQVDAYGMVLSTFVRQAVRGQPITIHGDGEQTRTFCHVSDTCRALIALIESPHTAGMAVNVGGESPLSIVGLAEMVKLQADSPSEMVFVSHESVYGPGFEDTMDRQPSIDRARSVIGWEPSIGIEAIIDDVIAYERSMMLVSA